MKNVRQRYVNTGEANRSEMNRTTGFLAEELGRVSKGMDGVGATGTAFAVIERHVDHMRPMRGYVCI
ncbi:hypothetical protein FH972_012133 [Carpinus fangiana]|uniref:Uncharacterized protein n=1 Tax=Carpinus fangiana TaxID=176857 RepID=A0A5N6R2X2_9ROSI|nr:hypothetical protein FH972_012133 [Carpinus fangiana]